MSLLSYGLTAAEVMVTGVAAEVAAEPAAVAGAGEFSPRSGKGWRSRWIDAGIRCHSTTTWAGGPIAQGNHRADRAGQAEAASEPQPGRSVAASTAGLQPRAGDGRLRGLLVDWGGVMTSNVFDAFRAFCERHGIEPDAVGKRFRSDPASRELLIGLETGTLPEEEFEPRFAEMLGVPAAGLIDGLFAGGVADERMQSAVAQAREQGIRTGLISNSWGTRRYDRALLKRLFDGVVISGEIGVRKPTPEIYARGAEAISLPPSECVFVDDLPFNLPPAQELGMTTVHHTETDTTIAELQRLLGVTLR